MTIVVPACRGCTKVIGTTIQTCSAYKDPWKKHRLGRCPLHSVPLTSKKEVVKINPLKASKKSRGGLIKQSINKKGGNKNELVTFNNPPHRERVTGGKQTPFPIFLYFYKNIFIGITKSKTKRR